jgi:hypothetical protein
MVNVWKPCLSVDVAIDVLYIKRQISDYSSECSVYREMAFLSRSNDYKSEIDECNKKIKELNIKLNEYI